MTTQALFKKVDAEIKRGKSPLVVLSLEEWRQIEDIISELSSPQLLKSVARARLDYKKGRAIPYQLSKY